MSRSIRVAQRAARQVVPPVADLPTFLCPGLLRIANVQYTPYSYKQPRYFSQTSLRERPTSSSEHTSREKASVTAAAEVRLLPAQCAGCGALSQAVDSESPGFYTLSRKSLRQYLDGPSHSRQAEENEIIEAALRNAGEAAAGMTFGTKEAQTPARGNAKEFVKLFSSNMNQSQMLNHQYVTGAIL
jgi:hypothetical protein